ncbi:hypothetical protein ACO0LC_09420 [Undibacterium sp. JH2W]|uniref:hypothetical protein n=1 Tax=Undibacterium sp. JH2W TaxID=3413037 RepID=UPI003BF3CEC6
MRLISNEELILVAGGDGEGEPVDAGTVVIVGHVPYEPGLGPETPSNPRNPVPSPYQPPITKIE